MRAEPMRAPGFCTPSSAKICQWHAPLCIPAAFLHLSLLMCPQFGLSPLLSSTILPTSSSHLWSSNWHCNCSVSLYICMYLSKQLYMRILILIAMESVVWFKVLGFRSPRNTGLMLRLVPHILLSRVWVIFQLCRASRVRKR